ncbi:GntR family transcriptional regulator [Hwanghaeella sp.]|uniref:GntR family transcriptional regulator n=1 Tax=Hwanghaeella sp. TaxID=2605943 RepID=UPI003CCBC8C1
MAATDKNTEIVRGATLTEQVYAELRQRLLQGQFKPGERITARALSRSMGVSLTPARDAIARLVREGAIEISETHMFSIPVLQQERYRAISQIRISLEPMAAKVAVEKAGKSLADKLEKLNEAMRNGIERKEFDESLRYDSEFHFSLYHAADKPDLERIIDGLWVLTGPTRTKLPIEYRQGLNGYNNHVKIIEGVRRGDADAVAQVIAADIANGSEMIAVLLD